MNAGSELGKVYLHRCFAFVTDGLSALSRTRKDKRHSIRRYFKIKPAKNWWDIFLGIVIIFGPVVRTDLDHSSWLVPVASLVGLCFVMTGWGARPLDWTLPPSDREIDRWTREDFQALNERALQRAGIERSELAGDPIPIYGPGDVKPRKVGEDKRLRFGRYGGVVITFTGDRLLIYSCVVDISTGNTLSESTDEYWYRDVVSVSTKTLSGHLGRKQVSTGEYFILTTSRGSSAEVLLRSAEVERLFGGELPANDGEEAILAVRKMLREKKSSTSGS